MHSRHITYWIIQPYDQRCLLQRLNWNMNIGMDGKLNNACCSFAFFMGFVKRSPTWKSASNLIHHLEFIVA